MIVLDQSRKQCLISVAVLLLILGAVLFVTLVPWWSAMSQYGDQADQMAERIARYQYLIESRPEFEKQLRQFGQQQAAKGYLIKASDPDLAAAQLQQRIKLLTKENGASLASTQNLPAAAEDDAGRIVIRARINGDAEALSRVLYALESGQPLLMVENLSIRSRQKRSRSRRGKKATEKYELNVNLDVVGYMQGGVQ